MQFVYAGNLETTVTNIQSHKRLLKETRLKASRLTSVQSVRVTNIIKDMCTPDKLTVYFRNKKISGGGKSLRDVKFIAEGEAIITFQEAEGVFVHI